MRVTRSTSCGNDRRARTTVPADGRLRRAALADCPRNRSRPALPDGMPKRRAATRDDRASSERVTVADLSRLMSERAGYDGRIRFESGDEAVERLGAVGEAALLDQIAEPSMAAAIGWEPTGPSLAQEIRAGDFDWAVGSVRPFRRER